MHWTKKEVDFILQNKDLGLETLKDSLFYTTGINRTKNSIKKKLWSLSEKEATKESGKKSSSEKVPHGAGRPDQGLDCVSNHQLDSPAPR